MKVAPLSEEKNTNTSAEQDLTVNTASGWFLWLIVIGFMLFVFAFFTNNWHVEPTKWSGLWMVCGISSGFVGEGVMEATHACMVVAIVFYCTSYLMLILYLFSEPQCVGPKFILVLFFISSLLTTIFIVSALVVFGVAVKKNLAFSFFLEGISAFLSLGTSILAIVQVAQEG